MGGAVKCTAPSSDPSHPRQNRSPPAHNSFSGHRDYFFPRHNGCDVLKLYLFSLHGQLFNP